MFKQNWNEDELRKIIQDYDKYKEERKRLLKQRKTNNKLKQNPTTKRLSEEINTVHGNSDNDSK